MGKFTPDSEFVPDAEQDAAPPQLGPNGKPFTPDSEFVPDRDQYGSPQHALLAGAEGFANTASLGGYSYLSKKADEALGLDPNFSQKVREAHPIAYGAGQVGALLAPTPGAAVFGASKALAGSAVAGSFLSNALFQAQDEFTKMVNGDPHQTAQTAAINVGLAGVLGSGLAAAGKISDGFVQGVQNRLSGILDKSEGGKLVELFQKGLEKAPESAGAAAGAVLGHAIPIPGMGYAGAYIGAKVLGPVFRKVLEASPLGEGFEAGVSYLRQAVNGETALNDAVSNLFEAGKNVVPSKLLPTREDKESIKDSLNSAQDNPQSLIEGQAPLDHYFPEHNVAVGRIKGAAVDYLNAVKPKTTNTGLFDTKIEPSKAQEAMFDRTLGVAQQPLMVLQHVKEGTLLPQDLTTLDTIYPGMRQRVAQKLTNAVIEHTAAGGVVSYKIRLGLSMLTAAPLDTTMRPEALQSIQSHFMPKQPAPAPQAGNKMKKGTKPLSKLPSTFQTPGQARQADKQSE
jgi:hypothetical protein